jgi:hypothetical protein
MTSSSGTVDIRGGPVAGVSTFSYVVQDSLGAASTGSITVTTTSGGSCH